MEKPLFPEVDDLATFLRFLRTRTILNKPVPLEIPYVDSALDSEAFPKGFPRSRDFLVTEDLQFWVVDKERGFNSCLTVDILAIAACIQKWKNISLWEEVKELLPELERKARETLESVEPENGMRP